MSTEGHNEPCYYCNQLCNDAAGNPGLWSLGFTHEDEPGVVKWHHTGCVQLRLRGMEAIKAALGLPQVTSAEDAVAEIRVRQRDRDEYKLAADTWQADALRDAAALEKVRKLLGTTVVVEAVPTVLEKRLNVTSGATKERVYDGCHHTIDINGDVARCRRKTGHSGTHAFSLNQARALDAVVTHEDLRKLKAEILDELIDRKRTGG